MNQAHVQDGQGGWARIRNEGHEDEKGTRDENTREEGGRRGGQGSRGAGEEMEMRGRAREKQMSTAFL